MTALGWTVMAEWWWLVLIMLVVLLLMLVTADPVSYTHLTLPTIYSV